MSGFVTGSRNRDQRQVPLFTGFIAGVARAIRDPRIAGVLRAGPRVVDFLIRSHRRTAGIADDDSIVKVRPTPALAAQAYLDEVLIAALRHPDLLPKEEDYVPAAADLTIAREIFAVRGWIDHPATYHRDPPAPDNVRAVHETAHGLGYEHTTFESGWEPYSEEPGRARWLEHQANRTSHAWVSRAPGRDHGSWMVCLHGFGMGQHASIDLRSFRTTQLHRMGIHVAVVVLPLHGPRASGRVRGEDLMTIDMVDSMHGMAQATWDARRLIAWLRVAEGAERVGVMGQSLGGLVASLAASLEPELRCVIAGVPVVDLPDLFRRHSPPAIAERARHFGVLGDQADDVHRVVSPLAMACAVPKDGRYIYAGLGDRMSTFGQARRLWLHWDRPTLAAYPGGHLGFFWSKAVKELVVEAMTATFPPAA
ncbi:MAG: alpha/beta hydrolase family protein [Acidimicrobiales bacterium]|jgi:pimeloyl-ACP methyl ester carboxylesterase